MKAAPFTAQAPGSSGGEIGGRPSSARPPPPSRQPGASSSPAWRRSKELPGHSKLHLYEQEQKLDSPAAGARSRSCTRWPEVLASECCRRASAWRLTWRRRRGRLWGSDALACGRSCWPATGGSCDRRRSLAVEVLGIGGAGDWRLTEGLLEALAGAGGLGAGRRGEGRS